MNIRSRCNCDPIMRHIYSVGTVRVRESLYNDRNIPLNKIYLKIHYNVLYDTIDPTSNVSLELLQSQHAQLNKFFNKLNDVDLDKTPVESVNTVGKADIVFIPEDSMLLTEMDVLRLPVYNSRLFTSLNEVLRYCVEEFSLSVNEIIIPGTLNVFMCQLDGTLLGQAELGSSVVLIDSRTVGSMDLPNPNGFANYNFGKTLIHEIGHAFSLPHPFKSPKNTANCLTPPFDDIPSQLLPNYTAYLYKESSTGRWLALHDNRQIDCAGGIVDGESPPYSCVSTLGINCTIGPFEHFYNIMDYSSDVNLIMFSNDQCKKMREWLYFENEVISILDEQSNIVPNAYQINVTNKEDNKNFRIILIIVSVTLAIVFLVIIVYILYKKRQ